MATVNGTKKIDVITVKNASSVIVVTKKKSTSYKISKKGKNYIFGNAGKDTIIVKGGKKNYIYGDDKKGKASAIDTITINKGNLNTIYGGKGNDAITIKGGKKNTIDGGNGNDTFTITGGKKNTISGDNGNDTFTITGGKKTIISGGAGSDSFIYVESKKKASVTIKDYKYGENGTGDTFTVQKAAVSGLTKSGKNLKFTVGKSSVTLTKTVDASVYVNDNRGGYFVYVDSSSGFGSVWLDKFTGATFDAGKFTPITDISLNSSEIKKGITLKGNTNDNYISGGNYNDKLYGKGGNNTLYGGSGNDTFVFDTTSKGANTVNDYNAGDIIAFSGGIGYNNKTVTVSDNDVILNLTTGGTIKIVGAKGNDITFNLNGKITHETFS